MNDKTIYLIFGGLLLLLGVVSFFILSVLKKKDRKFEKKNIVYYLLITVLLFFCLGLIGLFSVTYDNWIYTGLQMIALLFGVYHAWALFYNYDWSDHISFWPESLFTFSVTLLAGFGLLGGLAFWVLAFNGFELEFISIRHLSYYSSAFCILLPYLLLRTYDYIKQIPPRTYVAWYFPDSLAPMIDLSDQNVVFVYMDLFVDAGRHPVGHIKEHRSRIPLYENFGDFFQNFVQDYNGKHPQNKIVDLRENQLNDTIGWTFYAKGRKGSRRRLIDPFEVAIEQVEEGDLIIAKRVILGEKQQKNPLKMAYRKPDRINIKPADEDDIIFQEK